MAKARALALALGGVVGVLALQSCSPFSATGLFTCREDSQCAGGGLDGRCELPAGYCSFSDERCGPGGRSYGEQSGSLSGVCVGSEPPADAGDIDARVEPDAQQPEAGAPCYGAVDGLVQACFGAPPTGDKTLTDAINTDDNSGDCASGVTATTACVIAGASITIPSGATVTVTGSRPLVLVAVGDLVIDGTLDAASRRSLTAVGGAFPTAQIGANANAGCAAGTPPNASGGGAGGTFGTRGGDGGDGQPAGNGDGGEAAPLVDIATLRGGCDGQEGKNQAGGAGGLAGHGGGAVYLIADGAIRIGGTINASGEGGGPGVTGRAGGGGGGAGGMIGLDAPTIANGGQVFANGGGGAEGSGNNTRGAVGREATSVALAGPSGDVSNGASGGGGGQDGMESLEFGGGGGGGGLGVIRVFRGTLGGTTSPPPR